MRVFFFIISRSIDSCIHKPCRYQVDFGAAENSVAPSLFLNPTNPVSGMCTGPRQPGSGSVCEIRDNYQVVASTQTSNDTSRLNIVLRMKKGRVINTVSLPTGTVIQSLVTACPSVGVGVGTPTQLPIRLTNTQSKTIRVNIVRTGSPCTFNTSVQIAPTKTLEYNIDRTCVPYCDAACLVDNPDGVASAVFVTSLAQNGSLVYCNQDPIITNTDETVFANASIVTPKALNASVTSVYSVTSSLMLDLFVKLSQFSFNLYIANVQMTMSAGVPINDTAIATGLSLSDQLNALVAQAFAQHETAKNTTYPDPGAATDEYLLKLKNINDSNNAFMEIALQKLRESNQSIFNMTQDLNFIRENLTDIRNDAQKRVDQALDNVTTAVTGSLNKFATALAVINKGKGWGSGFGSLGSAFSDIGDAFVSVAETVADKAGDLFSSWSSGFKTAIFVIVFLVSIGIVVLAWGLYKGFRNRFKPETSDVADGDRFTDMDIIGKVLADSAAANGGRVVWGDKEKAAVRDWVKKTSHVKTEGRSLFTGRAVPHMD